MVRGVYLKCGSFHIHISGMLLYFILALSSFVAGRPVFGDDDTHVNHATRSLNLSREIRLQCAFNVDDRPDSTNATNIHRPRNTCEICIAIADSARKHGGWFTELYVDAKDAYACLDSVSIRQHDALATLDSIKRLFMFQSTIMPLKDPQMKTPPVDLLGGLNIITSNITSGTIQGEYEFEKAIATLTLSAQDEHLRWIGKFFVSGFLWHRSSLFTLVVVAEGDNVQVYTLGDLGKPWASPVTQIDGDDTAAFLMSDKADVLGDAEDHSRWNQLTFVGQRFDQAENRFNYPLMYPGPTTTLKFLNGTTRTEDNKALLLNALSWRKLRDMDSLYSSFAQGAGTARSTPIRARNLQAHPRRPVQKRSFIEDPILPVNNPKPDFMYKIADPNGILVQDDEDDEEYCSAGYFVPLDPNRKLAVLDLHDFEPLCTGQADSIAAFVQRSQQAGITNFLIDLRGHNGGVTLEAHDIFNIFFPNTRLFAGARMRTHPALDFIGTNQKNLKLTDDLNYVVDYKSFIDYNAKPFADWEAFWGPDTILDDKYTRSFDVNRLQFPNKDGKPLVDVDGVDPKQFVILSDGRCRSSCALLADSLVAQGMRTAVVGGTTKKGSMSYAPDIRGLGLVAAEDFESIVLENGDKIPEAIQDVLPFPPPIAPKIATINLMSRYAPDQPTVPQQFRKAYADCRLWFTMEMLADRAILWATAYNAAMTGEGCINH